MKRGDLVYREHVSAGADPVRQLESGEPRTAAEIEQTVARAETGAVPEAVGFLRPQAMLRLEPPPFLGIGAEEIRIFRGGAGVCHCLRSGWWNGASPLMETRRFAAALTLTAIASLLRLAVPAQPT